MHYLFKKKQKLLTFFAHLIRKLNKFLSELFDRFFVIAEREEI